MTWPFKCWFTKDKSEFCATLLCLLVICNYCPTTVSSYVHTTGRRLGPSKSRYWLVVPTAKTQTKTAITLHLAKKKGGKGFGNKDNAKFDSVREDPKAQDSAILSGLDSISSQTYDLKPKQVEIDPSLPAEERAKEILRQQYGLRSFEEQRADAAAQDAKRKFAEMKKRADAGKDIDIFQLVPAPLLILIDRFLKLGLTVTTLLFIGAGLGITVEAWSVASGNALPENLDDFIVNTIEPNFTLGLVVLLGFSISLGLFASAQLGSESSQYSERGD